MKLIFKKFSFKLIWKGDRWFLRIGGKHYVPMSQYPHEVKKL